MILDPHTGSVTYSGKELKDLQSFIQEKRDEAMICKRFEEVEFIKEIAEFLCIKIRTKNDA